MVKGHTVLGEQGHADREPRGPMDENQLAQWLVWGSADEALRAASHPATPLWAIRRALREREEPEVQRALAVLGDLSDPAVARERAKHAERLLEAETRQQTQEEIALERAQLVDAADQALEQIRGTVQAGLTAYLHRWEFIASGFSIDGSASGAPPSASGLGELGWQGWDVVTALPHTTGLSLSNMIGGQKVLAGGIGLTDGVYLLLRLPITAEVLSRREEWIRENLESLIASHLAAGRTPDIAVPALVADAGRSSLSTRATVASSAPLSFIGYGMTVSHPDGDDDAGDIEGDTDFGGDADFGGFDC